MDLIDREQALACFWSYANDDGTGYDETDMPAYDRLQALPIVAEAEDCISRQAAIDALCKAGCDSGYCGVSCDDVMAIENLPSAQPQRWIPVTERLPKEDGYYLVTVKHRYRTATEVCSFDGLDGEKPFCPTDRTTNWKHLNRGYPRKMTVAWMPLPDPYKGKSNG